MSHPIPRWFSAASLVLAPVAGVIAAVASPGLSTTTRGELSSIASHSERFHVYAVAVLVSGYLLVPAFFALMALVRTRSDRWAYLAGGLAQIGIVIAVGDAAVELMYWKMGAPGADRGQMVALSDRYDAGSGWIYGIGGIAVLLGAVLLTVALWRTRTLPRWAAVGVSASCVLNIAGFSAGSQPVLIASYVVMLAAFARAAVAYLDLDAPSVEPRVARATVVAERV